MIVYQLKIEIKPYKADEFVDCMRSIFGTIRKEKAQGFCRECESESGD